MYHPTWRNMDEADRDRVRDWLRQVAGVDPDDVQGYRVQGDQLLVQFLCGDHRAGTAVRERHRHANCAYSRAHPHCRQDPCQLQLGDLCTYTELR